MEHKDCMNCNLNDFANLYYKTIEGGELFVLEESISQKKVVLCEVMVLPDSCFKLLLVAQAYERMDLSPFIFLTWQCIYDLKASAFLSLTAHYRSAIQLLRPVMENTLIACYFKEKFNRAASEENRNQVWKDFEAWTKEEYKINAEDYSRLMGKTINREMPLDFGYAKTWLKQNDAINGSEQGRLDDLKGQLNKYLHPHFSRMEISNVDLIRFPATVKFDKDQFDIWAEFYHDISGFVIEKIIGYYPFVKDVDDGKSALNELKLMEELESDIKRPIIKSKHLREFIAQLPS